MFQLHSLTFLTSELNKVSKHSKIEPPPRHSSASFTRDYPGSGLNIFLLHCTVHLYPIHCTVLYTCTLIRTHYISASAPRKLSLAPQFKDTDILFCKTPVFSSDDRR